MFFGLTSPCTTVSFVCSVRWASSSRTGATSGWTRAVARRYGSMRSAWNDAPVSNSAAAVGDFANAACMKASWRPTVAAVSGMTQPRASCDFHSSWRSGGRYSIAKTESVESEASTAGTRSALSVPTCLSHCTSVRLREASARHSAATRRRPSARFTQYSEEPARTSQMSDDTPPASGSNCGISPGGTSPARSRKSRISCTCLSATAPRRHGFVLKSSLCVVASLRWNP